MGYRDMVLLCFAFLVAFALLVDDYTTGRALRSCSAELKEARATLQHSAVGPGSCIVKQGDYFAIVDLACLEKNMGADKK